MEEDSKENPYLDPFFVIALPIAIVIGIESVVVWFETAVYPKGFIYLSKKERKKNREKKVDVSHNKVITSANPVYCELRGGKTSLFVEDRFREDGAGQYQFEARRCDVPTEEREECACGVGC